jgi:hypothetical protein
MDARRIIIGEVRCEELLHMEREEMILRKRLRLAATALALATTLGVGGLMAGTASAATGADSPHQGAAGLAKTVTYHSRTYTLRKTITPSGAAARSDAAVSAPASPSCGLYVSAPVIIEPQEAFGPYYPFLVSVGGDSVVQCTIVVTSINLTGAVAWDNVAVLGTTVNSAFASATPLAYALDVCTSGDWAVGGVGTIVWPAAYNSPPSNFAGYGPDFYVDPTTC